MSRSKEIGDRFERAALELFKIILPELGFEIVGDPDIRRGGSQYGFDLLIETRPVQSNIRVNFFVECKGAADIGQLPLSEFAGKPEQLLHSRFNPDYWILFSPLRYLTNEFKESLQYYRKEYPFALIDLTRKEKDNNRSGKYLDLFKHYPEIYGIFKEDIPGNLRDTPPGYQLGEIIESLKEIFKDAYRDYHDRAVEQGIVRGIRRITPNTVHSVKTGETIKLDVVKQHYFHLDSTHKTLLTMVCKDAVIRNKTLEKKIIEEIKNRENINRSIAVLGSEGCGKSTLLYILAAYFALKNYPVLLMDTLDIRR